MAELTFRFTDEEGEVRLEVPLKNVDSEAFITAVMDGLAVPLEEKYGVHDYSGTAEIVGFTSYEITDWEGVCREWRALLKERGWCD